MNLWILGLALALIVVGGASYVWYQDTRPQPVQPAQTPRWPDNMHLYGGVCVGSYYNNVSVAWPATNGHC